MFVPFEGGNADSIVSAAAAAKAAGVLLYDPTPTDGEEYHYELTQFDVPVASTDQEQYQWMLQQDPEGGPAAGG
ncbi:MAG: hypothetical protein ACLSHU_08495 [Oscillospiraceae bacterium]